MVNLNGLTVSVNTAQGGQGGYGPSLHKKSQASSGAGKGGGVYIGSGASVYLDAFTQNHVTKNKASTSDPDIAGVYSIG